jgi:anti-sigma factor RsiW
MNHETQLKIQAYLDGELSSGEKLSLEHQIAIDSEAKALFIELHQTSSALIGNEASPTVPLTREFYWSKIERSIEHYEKQAAPAMPQSVRWLRWLAPVGVLSAMAIATFLSLREATPDMDEIETPLEQSSVYSFCSPSEKMSVVWVQSDINQEFTSPNTEGKAQPDDEI